MLVGRSTERELLMKLVAGAREETAGVVLLRGEPGIGKTSLLEFAAAAADGFRVLQIQGHESEMEIPFAALSWLLDPLSGLLAQLPPVQAQAMAGALQLGPAAGAGDRLAVAAGTLTLLAAAADECPLLIAVDDAHWLDVSSLEAIAFAARRLQAEAIAMVLTARPFEDVPAEVNRLLEALSAHTVSGLDSDAARELLAAQHLGMTPAVLSQRVADSAGNPLALVEFSSLGEDTLLVEPLRIGKRLEQEFGRRIETMPPATLQAMLLVAAAGISASDALSRALELQHLSAADLEPAETAGLLVSDHGNLRFHHPLVRSALYQSASPAQRRAAHHVLADVFGSLSTPRAQERHAWHLAAAALGPDEKVAATLDAAADAAAALRSYATAMNVQERSAQLSPPGDGRARRLLKAAELSFPAGLVLSGLPLLDRVLEETSEWRMRTEAQHLRCRIQMWAGQPVAGRDLLIAEADRVEPKDPAWSAIMRAHAALASAMLGEQRLASAEGQRAIELLGPLPDSLTMPALVVRALTLATAGQMMEARSMLVRCEKYLAEWDMLSSDQILLVAALAWAMLEEPEQVMRWLSRAVRAAREASAIGLLPFQLSWLALAQWRGGSWPAAYSNAYEAIGLAEETGWRTELPNSLAALAKIEASMGHAESCRQHAARAVTLGNQAGIAVIEAHASVALALLELGTGDVTGAIRDLEFASAFARSHELGDPALLSWAGDLVEALDHAADADRARTVSGMLDVEAERSHRPTEYAVAARCRGLLAHSEQAARDAFAEALTWHARAAQPFQEARTRLRHGEMLRRYRRRAEARAELGTALDVFDRLGAEPWAARARNELRATGITASPRSHPGRQQLTPQELRVALVVADGATNAEAAVELFLSAKTVEYHLSGAYRKLGIRSRAQLVRALAGAPGQGPRWPAR